MALDAAQQAKIRRYLGYPDANTYQTSDLAGAMERISAAGEAEVETILADLATLDTRASTVAGTTGLARVEDVWFSPGAGFADLRQRREQLVDELAALLGVTPFGGARAAFCPRG